MQSIHLLTLAKHQVATDSLYTQQANLKHIHFSRCKLKVGPSSKLLMDSKMTCLLCEWLCVVFFANKMLPPEAEAAGLLQNKHVSSWEEPEVGCFQW